MNLFQLTDYKEVSRPLQLPSQPPKKSVFRTSINAQTVPGLGPHLSIFPVTNPPNNTLLSKSQSRTNDLNRLYTVFFCCINRKFQAFVHETTAAMSHSEQTLLMWYLVISTKNKKVIYRGDTIFKKQGIRMPK